MIHFNVADFAVAVERVVDARLRRRPVLVAAAGLARAAVYDMSEEAFQAGVRKGMPLRRAEKICRGARIVPPHPGHYERAMQAFLKHTRRYSPLIEAGEDNGHLFMDVTGTGRLFGPPEDVSWRIRRTVKSDLGLDPIWSVAPNKLVAKVASRLVKPTGEYIVEAGEEEDFLRPLPIHLLPGVESDDLIRIRDFHIRRAGELARWDLRQLGAVFGKRGGHLFRAVRGIDRSPVLPLGRQKPSIRFEHDFPEDTNDRTLLESVVYALVEKAGYELRTRARAARMVVVGLDYSDGPRIIRRKTARRGTAHDHRLFALARESLYMAWCRRVRIRRLSLTCGRLVEPPAQMELFPLDDEDDGVRERLSSACDQIRNRFGPDSICLGRTLAWRAP